MLITMGGFPFMVVPMHPLAIKLTKEAARIHFPLSYRQKKSRLHCSLAISLKHNKESNGD